MSERDHTVDIGFLHGSAQKKWKMHDVNVSGMHTKRWIAKGAVTKSLKQHVWEPHWWERPFNVFSRRSLWRTRSWRLSPANNEAHWFRPTLVLYCSRPAAQPGQVRHCFDYLFSPESKFNHQRSRRSLKRRKKGRATSQHRFSNGWGFPSLSLLPHCHANNATMPCTQLPTPEKPRKKSVPLLRGVVTCQPVHKAAIHYHSGTAPFYPSLKIHIWKVKCKSLTVATH